MKMYKVFDKGRLYDIITYIEGKPINQIKKELIADGSPKSITVKFYRNL